MLCVYKRKINHKTIKNNNDNKESKTKIMNRNIEMQNNCVFKQILKHSPGALAVCVACVGFLWLGSQPMARRAHGVLAMYVACVVFM